MQRFVSSILRHGPGALTRARPLDRIDRIKMWKPATPTEEDAGSRDAAEDESGESQAACSDIVFDFVNFANECGAAIWAIAEVSIADLPDIDSPELIIGIDVFKICGAIANTGDVPDDFVRLCHRLSATLIPSRFEPALLGNRTAEAVLSSSLRESTFGVSPPLAVEFLSRHDEMYGGIFAQRAATLYATLVLQLFTFYLPSLRNDPTSATAAAARANEFLKLLTAYLDGDGCDRDHASDAQPDNEMLGGNDQSCSECSTAYQLLELPFGAPNDQVRTAQRELAKSLHPDSWGPKRGARFAEEQLKQVNAACDHLATCRTAQRAAENPKGANQTNNDQNGNQYRSPAGIEFAVMPKMGESITEGVITAWLKQLGDKVMRDEPLLEVSTDKVDAEIPAPASGILAEIIVQVGVSVPVGTILCVINKSGVDPTTGHAHPSEQQMPDPPSSAGKQSGSQAGTQQDPTEDGHPSFWRIAKVFFQAVWRVSKILLATSFAAIAAAVVLLGIFMALWEYWDREARREKGNFDASLLNSRLFSSLESITWVPRHIWGGLMLVATMLFFLCIFAGRVVWEWAASNWTIFCISGCLIVLATLLWAIRQEWTAEFTPNLQQVQPNQMSWVMGLVVVIASAGALGWLTSAHRLPTPEQNAATNTSWVAEPAGQAQVAPEPQTDTRGVEAEQTTPHDKQPTIPSCPAGSTMRQDGVEGSPYIGYRCFLPEKSDDMEMCREWEESYWSETVTVPCGSRASGAFVYTGPLTCPISQQVYLPDPSGRLSTDITCLPAGWERVQLEGSTCPPGYVIGSPALFGEDDCYGPIPGKDSETRPDVRSTLNGWAAAIKANDLTTELGYYGDVLDRYFLRRSVTKQFIAEDKQRFYAVGKHFIDYYVDQVVIDQTSPITATISVVKHWQVSASTESGVDNGETRSRLWFTRTGGDWKITGEQDLR